MRGIQSAAFVIAVILAAPSGAAPQGQPGEPGRSLSVATRPAHPVDALLPPDRKELRPAIIAALDETDPTRSIEEIEDLLPLFPETAPVRGFLETRRAMALAELGAIDNAVSSFEALHERLPRFLAIDVTAITTLAYTDAADFAAREWIDLAARSPAAARLIDGYTLGALTANLDAKAETPRKVALFLALDRIGYDPGTTALRDEMQAAIFANAANDPGREAEAKTALMRVSDPAKLLTIAAQARYREYWRQLPFDPAWLNETAKGHLTDLKHDFVGRDDGLSGGAFLSAAAAYTDPQAVAAAYGPVLAQLFSQAGSNTYNTFDVQFWVAPMARTWTAAGDRSQAENLFKSALNLFDDTYGTINLNISANYALYLLEDSRPQEALYFIEPAIAELEAVNQSLGALMQMHAVKLRAHYELGQVEKAISSRQYLEEHKLSQLDAYCEAMLAIGDDAAAKAAIVEVLRSPDPKPAISLLQLSLAPLDIPSHARKQARLDRMRQHPEVIEALRPVGRIVEIPSITVDGVDHASIAEQFLASS